MLFGTLGIHKCTTPSDPKNGKYWVRFALDARKLFSSASDEKVLRVEADVRGILGTKPRL
jgi:hypothetical protein